MMLDECASKVLEEMFAVCDGYIDVSFGDGFDEETIKQYQAIIAKHMSMLVTYVVGNTISASGSTITEYQGLSVEEIAEAICHEC